MNRLHTGSVWSETGTNSGLSPLYVNHNVWHSCSLAQNELFDGLSSIKHRHKLNAWDAETDPIILVVELSGKGRPCLSVSNTNV